MSDQQKKGESAAAAGKKEEDEHKGEGKIAIEELVSINTV